MVIAEIRALRKIGRGVLCVQLILIDRVIQAIHRYMGDTFAVTMTARMLCDEVILLGLVVVRSRCCDS